MKTSNAKQNFRSDAPLWIFFAELSLSEYLSDRDRRDCPTAGSLFQTMRALGMSPECMANIVEMLAGVVKETMARTKQGKPEFLGRIRIFCQKKILDDAKSAQDSGPDQTEQPERQNQIFPDSRANTLGGWGYFIIERGENLPPDWSAIPQSCIDLYLYKEGE